MFGGGSIQEYDICREIRNDDSR
nr:hypothetical protein [uncultured Mediterraneibacter sp.]